MGYRCITDDNRKDVMVLWDEDGTEYRLAIYEILEYQNEEYALFLLEGGKWEEEGFLVTKIVWENGVRTYIPIGDPMLNVVLDVFFEKHNI